jgi:ketosteroid isomerase-like protein
MKRAEIVKKLEAFVECFHTLDLDGVISMFAENGSAEHWTRQKLVGRQAIREEMRHFFNPAMGRIHYEVERVDVDESANVAWSVWVMTLTKDGTASVMHGCDTFEFDNNGLITRNAVFVKTDQPKFEAK